MFHKVLIFINLQVQLIRICDLKLSVRNIENWGEFWIFFLQVKLKEQGDKVRFGLFLMFLTEHVKTQSFDFSLHLQLQLESSNH